MEQELSSSLKTLTDAVNSGFQVTNDNVKQVNTTVRDDGSKTRSRVGLNTFLLLLIIALILYCCFFQKGCNVGSKQEAVAVKCDTTPVMIKVPVKGAIVEHEYYSFEWPAGYKGPRNPHAKYSEDDAERFEKNQSNATFQQKGFQVYLWIYPNRRDTSDCGFVIVGTEVDSSVALTTSPELPTKVADQLKEKKASTKDATPTAPEKKDENQASPRGKDISGTKLAIEKIQDPNVLKRNTITEVSTGNILWKNTFEQGGIQPGIKNNAKLHDLYISTMDSLFQSPN